jgi:hypothetical protein
MTYGVLQIFELNKKPNLISCINQHSDKNRMGILDSLKRSTWKKTERVEFIAKQNIFIRREVKQ